MLKSSDIFSVASPKFLFSVITLKFNQKVCLEWQIEKQPDLGLHCLARPVCQFFCMIITVKHVPK